MKFRGGVKSHPLRLKKSTDYLEISFKIVRRG